jgi:Ankyrin repeats (many copies)
MKNLNTCLFQGAIGTARQILESGVDINAKGDKGVYPIIAAINSDYPEVLRFVIAYGANPNITLDDGSTPLHEAFDIAIDGMLQDDLEKPNSETVEIIKLLIANGADPNVQNSSGKTPLDSLATYASTIERFNFLKDLFRDILPSIDKDVKF